MTVLRPAEARDHGALRAMRADADLMAALMTDPVEAAAEQVSAWIERREAQGFLRVIVDTDDRAVGFAQLAGLHRRNRTAWLGIAVARNARGQGHGGRGLRGLCSLAGETGLRKLKLEVRADNHAAIALYQGQDFRLVGRQLAEFDDGNRLHDTLIMERTL